jgi:hypothetical protein
VDQHVIVVRVVFAQLVLTDLVRAEKAAGTGNEKTDSLLVQVLKNGVME